MHRKGRRRQVRDEGPPLSNEAAEQLERADRLAVPLEETDLAIRIQNILAGRGINTIGQLVNVPYKELREIPSLGSRAITEVKQELMRRGIYKRSWGMVPPRGAR